MKRRASPPEPAAPAPEPAEGEYLLQFGVESVDSPQGLYEIFREKVGTLAQATAWTERPDEVTAAHLRKKPADGTYYLTARLGNETGPVVAFSRRLTVRGIGRRLVAVRRGLISVDGVTVGIDALGKLKWESAIADATGQTFRELFEKGDELVALAGLMGAEQIAIVRGVLGCFRLARTRYAWSGVRGRQGPLLKLGDAILNAIEGSLTSHDPKELRRAMTAAQNDLDLAMTLRAKENTYTAPSLWLTACGEFGSACLGTGSSFSTGLMRLKYARTVLNYMQRTGSSTYTGSNVPDSDQADGRQLLRDFAPILYRHLPVVGMTLCLCTGVAMTENE